MDRLAVGGLRFTAARAHNVVTLPSHANILAGRLPTDHGVRDNAGFRLPATEETLATRLKARRVSHWRLRQRVSARLALRPGSRIRRLRRHFVDAAPRPAFLEQERAGAETVGAASRWLQSRRRKPDGCAAVVLWVHLYEPHYPTRRRSRLRIAFARDAYAGEVAATDAALGPLLQPILDAGAATDTLVVLTSDHGESLGDHGEATHGIFAYEATLKVPLIVLLAAARRAASRRCAPRATSTSCRRSRRAWACRCRPACAAAACSTSHASDKATHAPFTYSKHCPDRSTAVGRRCRAWSRTASKYIDLPIPELYDFGPTHGEARNLAGASEPSRSRRTGNCCVGSDPVVRRADETPRSKSG